MKKLFLIYINVLGENWRGQNVYEFLFSDTTEDVDGEFWDKFPAAGNPEPPHSRFVKLVGILTTDKTLEVLQDSDTYAMWDGMDGVISIAWEDLSEYEVYPDKRLFFRFGEEIEVVKEKLYTTDNVLQFNEDDGKIN